MFSISDFLPLMFDTLHLEFMPDDGIQPFHGQLILVDPFPPVGFIVVNVQTDTLEECYEMLRVKGLALKEMQLAKRQDASPVSPPRPTEDKRDIDDEIPF